MQAGLMQVTTDGDHLSEEVVAAFLHKSFQGWNLKAKRLLVIIPDGTRTAPIPLLFRLIAQELAGQVAELDYLVALGTHPPMSEEELSALVGMDAAQRERHIPGLKIFNHHWDRPGTFYTAGVISAEESEELSRGMLSLEVPVRLNRLLLAYDRILICGPVFPHEVVGFSGGSKYISPGVSASEIINFTHWLGALITSYEIIGTIDTPVRDVIERVAAMLPVELRCLNLVVSGSGLAGMFFGEPRPSWEAAARYSANLHIRYVARPFQRVLSVMPRMYDDLWTGAKGMYKVEPAVADGGEVIIYAPHITEISYVHGHLIRQIGYHVRDYFVHQWERFKDYPWGVLAHSTHLRGIGAYEIGKEQPRVRVTLATGIPEAVCHSVNLGYLNPADVQLDEWAGREDEGLLLIPKAGETLYKLAPTA